MLDLSKINTDPIAVIGGVSLKNGVDLVETYPKSIDTKKFLFFLQRLRDIYWVDDLALIMDNLSVHKCNKSKERMDELGIEYVYITPYSPHLNAIEEVWAMSKRIIKKQRYQAIM